MYFQLEGICCDRSEPMSGWTPSGHPCIGTWAVAAEVADWMMMVAATKRLHAFEGGYACGDFKGGYNKLRGATFGGLLVFTGGSFTRGDLAQQVASASTSD